MSKEIRTAVVLDSELDDLFPLCPIGFPELAVAKLLRAKGLKVCGLFKPELPGRVTRTRDAATGSTTYVQALENEVSEDE